MALPDKLLNQLEQKDTQQIAQSLFDRMRIYLVLVGGFVTGAIGLLGVREVADKEDVAVLFATILGLIYVAQDGTTLAKRGTVLAKEIDSLSLSDIRRHKASLLKHSVILFLLLATLLVFALDDDTTSTFGLSDFSLPVRLLLVGIVAHFLIRLGVDVVCKSSQLFNRTPHVGFEVGQLRESTPLLNQGPNSTSVQGDDQITITDEWIGQFHKEIILILASKNKKSVGLKDVISMSHLTGMVDSKFQIGNSTKKELMEVDYLLKGVHFWLKYGEVDKAIKKIHKIFNALLENYNPQSAIVIKTKAPAQPLLIDKKSLNDLNQYYTSGQQFWQDASTRFNKDYSKKIDYKKDQASLVESIRSSCGI